MAKIYPREFPYDDAAPADKGILAEKHVYNQLRDKLPDSWTVMYNQWRYFISTGERYERYENYEADFIVLVPGKGVAVLEVKDWYKPKIVDGIWHRCQSGRTGIDDESRYVPCPKESPLNQAFLASKSLRAEILKSVPLFPNGKLECRALAVLCGTSENYENIGFCDGDSAAAQYIQMNNEERFKRLYVVGDEALNNIQKKIEEAFIFNNSFTGDHIRRISEHLLHNVRFKSDPKTCVAMMNNASAGLDAILPRLEHSLRGIHVSGCAGSGKTWMACNEIRRLHYQYQDKKILFLCYNRNLADYVLRDLLKDVSAKELNVDGDTRVHVTTFHALCRHICNKAKKTYQTDENGTILKDVLKSVREFIRGNVKCRYDYIFVDEAQDIKDDWWDFVITELKKHAGTLLYIFSDSNQCIFDEGQEVMSLPVRITLKHNLRNAYDIAQISTAVLPEAAQNIIPLPLKTEKIICSSGFDTPEERAAQVDAFIQAILDTNKEVEKKDIVVLSPYMETSSFNYLENVVDVPVFGEKPEAIRERIQRCLSGESDKVLGETVKSFKGLEAPFVILTDVNVPREKSGFTPNDFYVACTRAKYGLYIVPTVEGEKYIRELEKTAANLPSPLD